MPRLKLPKTQNHLIFVKNVSSSTAKSLIPRLYAQYNAVEYNNIYASSSITTVMIGFKTREEAVHAQRETDGIGMDNVILRVEMYSERQSVRILRERRRRVFGTWEDGFGYGDWEEDGEEEWVDEYGVGDGDADEEEKESDVEKENVETFGRVGGCVGKVATTDTLWAHVAARSRAANALNRPREHTAKVPFGVKADTIPSSTEQSVAIIGSPPRRSQSQSTTSGSELTDSNDRPSITTSHHNAKKTNSVRKTIQTSIPSQQTVHQAQVKPTAVRLETRPERKEMLAWPVETTEYVQQRHCAICWFCQMRRR